MHPAVQRLARYFYTDELLEAVKYIAQQPNIAGIEIVEVDPTLDFRDMTSRGCGSCSVTRIKRNETLPIQVIFWQVVFWV